MIEAGKKLICGVGYNDGKYIQVKGSDVEYAYNIWRKMLDRCYDEGFRKCTNTYSDCYVSEDFKQFSRFYEWAKNQVDEIKSDILNTLDKINQVWDK